MWFGEPCRGDKNIVKQYGMHVEWKYLEVVWKTILHPNLKTSLISLIIQRTDLHFNW